MLNAHARRTSISLFNRTRAARLSPHARPYMSGDEVKRAFQDILQFAGARTSSPELFPFRLFVKLIPGQLLHKQKYRKIL